MTVHQVNRRFYAACPVCGVELALMAIWRDRNGHLPVHEDKSGALCRGSLSKLPLHEARDGRALAAGDA